MPVEHEGVTKTPGSQSMHQDDREPLGETQERLKVSAGDGVSLERLELVDGVRKGRQPGHAP